VYVSVLSQSSLLSAIPINDGGVRLSADYEEQPVRIRLTDVNDEIPQFMNVPRPFLTTVSANAPPGASVYQLMAQDADDGSIVRYILDSGLCLSFSDSYR